MESYGDDGSSTAKDSDTESIALDKDGLLGDAQTRTSKSRAMGWHSRWQAISTAIMAIANLLLGALLIVQFQSRQHQMAASQAMSHAHHSQTAKKSYAIPDGRTASCRRTARLAPTRRVAHRGIPSAANLRRRTR